MTEQVAIDQLVNEIRNIYVPESDQTEKRIEQFLKKRLKNLPESDSLTVLKRLIAEFGTTHHNRTDDLILDHSVITRIYSLLLGKDVSKANLSSAELLQRLTESLNTIFNTLNELIRIINTTLFEKCLGKPGIQTIIESNPESLESYLGQIKTAFLTVQRAFEKTAEIKVGEILREIDPDKISGSGGGWLKIAPLKKAENYEIFEDKYRKIKNWFESDKFIEDFRREFENNCQHLLKY